MSDHISLAVRDVIAERVRQVHVKGHTVEHDDSHSLCELAAAAAAYALAATLNPSWRTSALRLWPWHLSQFRMVEPGRTVSGSRRRMLVKAGALVLAAIEWLDRRDGAHAAAPSPSSPQSPARLEVVR